MNWIAKLEELRKAGIPVVSVTVCNYKGSTPREIGAKMLVYADGRFDGTIGGGNLEAIALKDAANVFKEGVSKSITYPLGAKTGQCCGGSVDLLFELLNTEPRLYLFGAGHVGKAVCQTLEGTPFRVHLIDDREEWIHAPDLPKDTVRHACEWMDFVAEASWDAEKTYVAVMTHRHDLDQDIIADVVRRPAKYVGLIGSDSKWKRFQQRLAAKGFKENELARVKCPIGVSKAGKAPKEIAVHFASEILQVHHA